MIFTPILAGPALRQAAAERRLAGAPAGSPHALPRWTSGSTGCGATPIPRERCSRGSCSGARRRLARSARRIEHPALVIGHPNDPLHPFSDADMLVEEVPNARLVDANSILEWRLTPARLNDELAALPRPGLRRAPAARAPARARAASDLAPVKRASATLARRMATRKEEKARLRAARLEAERREAPAARKRLILGYGVAGVLTAAVLVGIVIVIASGGGGSSEDTPAAAHIDTATAASTGSTPDAREGTPLRRSRTSTWRTPPPTRAATCGSDLPDEGNTHLEPGAQTPNYRTNPPTSGNHVTTPFQQADGAYAADARADRVRPLARARPDRDPVRARPAGRRTSSPSRGSSTRARRGCCCSRIPACPTRSRPPPGPSSWGARRYEGAKTLDAIRDFRDQFRGRGPEGRSRSPPSAGGSLAHCRVVFLLPARPALAERGRDRRPEHDQHRQRVERPEVPVGDVREGRSIRRWPARAGTGPGR